MKLNFLKFNMLVLIVVAAISFSCEKDDIVLEPQKTANVQPNDISKPVLIKLNYIYKNGKYNESEWDIKSKFENKQFYMVGLNEDIHVFESESESLSYEKVLVSKVSSYSAIGDGCQVSGSVNITFKVNLFKDDGYANRTFAWLKTQTVSKSSLTGNLSGTSIDLDLPTAAYANTSSYKLEYVTAAGFKGAVGYPCRDLGVSINLYVEKIADLYGTNVLDFNKGYTFTGVGYSNESKLSDNKLVGALSLTAANSWDNKIKSLKVRIL